jgi:hypothetical protein
VSPFSYNSSEEENAPKRCKEGDTVSRIMAKRKVVNNDEIETRFAGKNLTSIGGIQLFHRFAGKLGLEEALEQSINLPRKAGKYKAGRVLVSLIYALVLDLTRLSDTARLQADRVFQRMAGFDGYPHQSTFSRFLKLFTVPMACRLGETNVSMLVKVRDDFKRHTRLTLDMDSHVETVYGNQQRAKVGYNPKKPGRKSFHPLLCFIGETRDFLWGKFRSGDNYTAHGAIGFLKECLRRLPGALKEIYLRADSGFFDGKFLDKVERAKVKYAIAAKLYNTIQARLGGIRYHDIGGGVEAGEFYYQGHTWKRARRMVVIRQEVKEEAEKKKQPKLFDLKGYSYQVIVTNIEGWSPEEVWRFYNRRACVENMIKEGMMGYGLDAAVSHYYGANAAHFFLVMLAYNLMNWFKEGVLGQSKVKRMAKWVRERFFYIPGRLIKRGRKWILNLWRDYPWQEEYHEAERRLEGFTFA